MLDFLSNSLNLGARAKVEEKCQVALVSYLVLKRPFWAHFFVLGIFFAEAVLPCVWGLGIFGSWWLWGEIPHIFIW